MWCLKDQSSKKDLGVQMFEFLPASYLATWPHSKSCRSSAWGHRMWARQSLNAILCMILQTKSEMGFKTHFHYVNSNLRSSWLSWDWRPALHAQLRLCFKRGDMIVFWHSMGLTKLWVWLLEVKQTIGKWKGMSLLPSCDHEQDRKVRIQPFRYFRLKLY